MHPPGQQLPRVAGLALSSPSSPGHLQFRFLVAKKIDMYLSVVKVVTITASPLKTGTMCALARNFPKLVSQSIVLHFQLEWHIKAIASPLHIGLDALLLPDSLAFSCPM